MLKDMEIILNGLQTVVPHGISVIQLIDLAHEQDLQLIVECNGEFIFPQDYASRIIEPGDKVELINPDFGG